MIYIGIDPGVSGGIAIIDKNKISALPMPISETDLWDIIKIYATPVVRHPSNNGYQAYAIMEKVAGMVHSSVGLPNLGSSMFSFGRSYGLCWMALIAAGIPFDLVHPRTWQKSYNISKDKGEAYNKWKGRLKGVAQRLFPRTKVTLATSDALLLAEYARRHYNGGK